jgi:predicted metalloprotease
MRWGDARRSDNVEDGRGGGSVRRIGLGGVVIALILSAITGRNPLEMLGLVQQVEQSIPQQPSPAGAGAANDPGIDFARAILGDTEDVWTAIFARSNGRYEQPKMRLFSGEVDTACGGATAASGPFYCPGDRKVYLDLSFFEEMRNKLGGGGAFAQAYVIAHEVGHHVQNLLGISAKVDEARRAGRDTRGAAGLSVRLELQADCFAGVWAHEAQQRHHWLEAGDIERALNTATAIGDDRLQKQARGTVVPESFTHGSSVQRVRWFSAGFDSGQISRCDTFAAANL